jgi:ABC-type multidrug transport system fused ATPase/permease subunit
MRSRNHYKAQQAALGALNGYIEETVSGQKVVKVFCHEEIAEEEVEAEDDDGDLPASIKNDVKSVLLCMDQLLESLPEDKIMEFAKSEQFATYKKLFKDLGLTE